ncbi:Hsp20 family protein [Arsukibacterium sp.]|uniref:Hsp20 family protein n=1 Tax=Arsukibacterium sp. TaxID=1977258 RepID=UPI00299E560C|nr:Hsp20 family protein [Arsukibacterium sp.]MDX1676893.1 Hsp20 family protein [Arsukibacterium sp.]
MNNLDFTPFYRSFIGFDHLANLMNAAARNEKQPAYPPYNIEVTGEDSYCITMAVAGFTEQELSIETENNTLVVQGQKDSKDSGRHFVHQGIAERNFERKFQLSDYVKVTGASLENGLLHIALVREVPEALKPRKIAIGNIKQPQLVTEDKATAEDSRKVKTAVNS